jgi:Concanavalin A-like lectin/glucanases superfamily
MLTKLPKGPVYVLAGLLPLSCASILGLNEELPASTSTASTASTASSSGTSGSSSSSGTSGTLDAGSSSSGSADAGSSSSGSADASAPTCAQPRPAAPPNPLWYFDGSDPVGNATASKQGDCTSYMELAAGSLLDVTGSPIQTIAGKEPRSITFWLRFTAPKGTSRSLFSWGTGTPQKAFVLFGSSIMVATESVGSTLAVDQWHHVALVFGPDTSGSALCKVKVFVNGTPWGDRVAPTDCPGALRLNWQQSEGTSKAVDIDEYAGWEAALDQATLQDFVMTTRRPKP